MHDCRKDRYYEVLGLDATASPELLKRAHRDLIQVWHPDRFTANPRLQQTAQEKLREINQAYDALRSMAAARPAAPSRRPSQAVPSTPLALRDLQHWLYLGISGFGAAAAIFVLIFSARGFCNYFTGGPPPAPVPLAVAPDKAPAPAVRHRPARTAARARVVDTQISNGYETVTPRERPGVGKISINNQTDQDAVASLLESDSGAKLRTVYVGANMQITIDGIGPGVYRIAFDSGYRITPRSAGTFGFTQVQTSGQVWGDQYSIVLRTDATAASKKSRAGI